MEYLVVVDMQHDFVDGALGSREAEAIVPKVRDLIDNFDGEVLFTRDTHRENYLDTQEGKLLPVKHCIEGTHGWELCFSEADDERIFNKNTFGSIELAEYLRNNNATGVTLAGLCTDICVVSNALLIKAVLPEIPVRVAEKCCAGTTPERHQSAIETMKSCQIICE